MEVIHARCCGLDVHKNSVVACVLITAPDGQVERQVRTFTTMTADLLALSDWLNGLEVTQVALESTGVYWQPVFNVLEDDTRTLLLVNPQHIGKKTDVRDSEWIADLLRHGLLRASFIPPAPIRAIRELTRYRKTLAGKLSVVAGKLSVVLYGMLKNMKPYDERKHREQLGLLGAADQVTSAPVEVSLELVDIADSDTGLVEDATPNDDFQIVL